MSNNVYKKMDDVLEAFEALDKLISKMWREYYERENHPDPVRKVKKLFVCYVNLEKLPNGTIQINSFFDTKEEAEKDALICNEAYLKTAHRIVIPYEVEE